MALSPEHFGAFAETTNYIVFLGRTDLKYHLREWKVKRAREQKRKKAIKKRREWWNQIWVQQWGSVSESLQEDKLKGCCQAIFLTAIQYYQNNRHHNPTSKTHTRTHFRTPCEALYPPPETPWLSITARSARFSQQVANSAFIPK